jgi:hypothetical protein
MQGQRWKALVLLHGKVGVEFAEGQVAFPGHVLRHNVGLEPRIEETRFPQTENTYPQIRPRESAVAKAVRPVMDQGDLEGKPYAGRWAFHGSMNDVRGWTMTTGPSR